MCTVCVVEKRDLLIPKSFLSSLSQLKWSLALFLTTPSLAIQRHSLRGLDQGSEIAMAFQLAHFHADSSVSSSNYVLGHYASPSAIDLDGIPRLG